MSISPSPGAPDYGESSRSGKRRHSASRPASQSVEANGDHDEEYNGRRSGREENSDDDADEEEEEEEASSPPAVVEYLSMGRSRRSTAGNRMRELLEQEREKLEAEGEDSGRRNRKQQQQQQQKQRVDQNGEAMVVDDDDEMFAEEEGDIDFEEKVDDEAYDIVDSDFDRSSNEGGDDDDEDDDEVGERRLQEEEKAAKKASRARAVPIGMRKPAIRQPAIGEAGPSSQQQPRAPRRSITFAVTTTAGSEGPNAGKPRASSRRSTMRIADEIRARKAEEEARRAALAPVKKPKKRLRLSQAELIADALEIEEHNRQSLADFMQREQERRERDKGKRGVTMDPGGFLRWRSVKIDPTGPPAMEKITEISATGEQKERVADSTVTEDPVVAARLNSTAQRQTTTRTNSEGEPAGDQSSLTIMDDPANQSTASAADQSVQVEADVSTEDVSVPASGAPSTAPIEAKATSEVPTAGEKPTASALPEDQNQSTSLPAATISTPLDGTASSAERSNHDNQAALAPKDAAPSPSPSKTQEQQQRQTPAPPEARSFVSVIDLDPEESTWVDEYKAILGDHCQWDRYILVPARNRPLRPRQSTCVITGLPAKYKDPVTGIPYASAKAYKILTSVVRGDYVWSKTAEEQPLLPSTSSSSTPQPDSKARPAIVAYDALNMGAYLDRLDEPGACGMLAQARDSLALQPQTTLPDAKGGANSASTASTTMGTTTTTASVATSNGLTPSSSAKGRWVTAPPLPGGLAPGDEKALIAAATALPAGTTRSGGRRGQPSSSSTSTPTSMK